MDDDDIIWGIRDEDIPDEPPKPTKECGTYTSPFSGAVVTKCWEPADIDDMGFAELMAEVYHDITEKAPQDEVARYYAEKCPPKGKYGSLIYNTLTKKETDGFVALEVNEPNCIYCDYDLHNRDLEDGSPDFMDIEEHIQEKHLDQWLAELRKGDRKIWFDDTFQIEACVIDNEVVQHD